LTAFSLTLNEGETLGIVGESGCGKSTLARCIVRLLDPPTGRSSSVAATSHISRGAQMRPIRREMMMVFQDPYASLNVAQARGLSSLRKALQVHKIGTEAEIKRRVQELLDIVGLSPEHYKPLPARVFGRAAPAHRNRAGASRSTPKLIGVRRAGLCTRCVGTGADPQSAQGSPGGVSAHLHLHRARPERDRHISDRIMVMYLGHAVENATREQLYREPRHPYTGAPALGGSGSLTEARARAPATRARGRRPESDQPTVGLLVPSALPAFPSGSLRRRRAPA